jgi:hypothetical protein
MYYKTSSAAASSQTPIMAYMMRCVHRERQEGQYPHRCTAYHADKSVSLRLGLLALRWLQSVGAAVGDGFGG